MADETPETPPTPQGTNNVPSAQDTPGPVPYDRFKQVNDQLAELKQWREKQEADAKTAREKQLAEQQKWQELAEQRENELKAERLNNQRLTVATQKGLPAQLVDRLRGETAEELAADADALLALIKPPEPTPTPGPGVPPRSRGGQPVNVDLSSMTPDEIRKMTLAR